MRTLSTLVQSALSGATVVARWIVRVALPGGTYGGSDGPMDFTWNNGVTGNLTYHGFGDALKIALPAQDAQSKLSQATLSLSATDPAVLGSFFEEDYRGAPTDIALLLFDPSTGAPGEEFLAFEGLSDVASITDDPAKATDPSQPQTSSLALTVSPRTIDLKRSSGRTGSDPDQRLYRDDNDSFFQDTAMVSLSAINWGQAGPASPINIALNSVTTQAPNGTFIVPSGLTGA